MNKPKIIIGIIAFLFLPFISLESKKDLIQYKKNNEFSKIIEICKNEKPEDIINLRIYANALWELNQSDKAIKIIDEAIQIVEIDIKNNPSIKAGVAKEHSRLYLLKCWIYMSRDNYDISLFNLNKKRDLYPSNEDYIDYFFIEFLKKNYKKALLNIIQFTENDFSTLKYAFYPDILFLQDYLQISIENHLSISDLEIIKKHDYIYYKFCKSIVYYLESDYKKALDQIENINEIEYYSSYPIYKSILLWQNNKKEESIKIYRTLNENFFDINFLKNKITILVDPSDFEIVKKIIEECRKDKE